MGKIMVVMFFGRKNTFRLLRLAKSAVDIQGINWRLSSYFTWDNATAHTADSQ